MDLPVLRYLRASSCASLPDAVPAIKLAYMTAKPGPENLLERVPAGNVIPIQRYAFDRPGVALALGGGFARGFAHLGVLEVLAQENIHISAIVGTSIGSLLGAAYADGVSIGKLCDLGRRIRVRDFLRFRKSPAAPRDNPIATFVRQWLHSSLVEELPIATAMVATDLSNCKPYVFTRGSLEIAISTSCAFPGLFDPIEYEGRLLADGCISAPVPTTIAARLGATCVLGVSVGPGAGPIITPPPVVRVRDLNRHMDPREHRLTPSWVLQADIFLEPEVSEIGWTDFTRVVEAYEKGANAMRLALPHTREILARRSASAIWEATSKDIADCARS
jgi:NTE family protein